MAKPTPNIPSLRRDGMSQAARFLAALQPGSVLIDERSTADLLAFVRAYGKQLTFYDDQDRAAGDWSRLLADDIDFADVVAFLRDPASLPADAAARLSRPHVALLLTFIELLGHARGQMNELTRRHLSFYVRDILGVRHRGPAPDRVNVLIQPAGAGPVLLPAGSLLDAGKDSQGAGRVYRTDRDIVANRARVAALRSVHIARHVTSIRSAYVDHEGTRDEAFLRMLEIALGDPRPGDPLPLYQGTETVDATLLRRFRDVIGFTGSHLHMELYELHTVMRLRDELENATPQWIEINGYLERAGKNHDPAFQIVPEDSRDFEANLLAAVGGPPDFDRLADVGSFAELYQERHRQDVQLFIVQMLRFPSPTDFVRMMQIKRQLDSKWSEINEILEQAGQRKRGEPAYRLSPAAPTDFAGNLEAAVGPIDYTVLPGISDLAGYHRELLDIESYFYLPAEDVAHMLALHDQTGDAADALDHAWEGVYASLTQVYGRRLYQARRANVTRVRLDAGADAEAALEAVFRLALGHEAGDEPKADVYDLAAPLREFVRDDGDYALLLAAVERASYPGDEPLTPADWERIDDIIEQAERVRERLPEPVAEHVEWLDIHPFADATAVAATLGIAADEDNPRWKTFGAEQPHEDPARAPAAVFGWAVSAPLLAMQEGERQITLTLGFRALGFDAEAVAAALEQHPFRVEISTSKGWTEVTSFSLVQGDYQAASGVSRTMDEALPALQLTLTMPESADPIAALPAGSDTGGDRGLPPAWPAIRLMLRARWSPARGRFVRPYAAFADVSLAAVHIAVAVSGLASLTLENDSGTLDGKKPFLPFGSRPALGARFYLGHPELVENELDSVRFHIDWMRVPGDLQAHYHNYDISADFRIRIGLHDRRRDLTLTGAAPLFAAGDAAASHSIEIAAVSAALEASSPGFAYERAPEAVGVERADTVSRWQRFLSWELTPLDFQHDVYLQLATAKSTEMAAAIASQVASSSSEPVDVQAYRVNPPYTPEIRRLRVDYSASTEVLMQTGPNASAPAPTTDCQLHHIHPFGTSRIAPSPAGADFLPRYDRFQGELYIGLRDVDPPQSLSLLVQMAEGSADPDLAPAPVEWSYLSGDRWLSMHEGNLLADGTRGLLTSGIIQLALEPCQPNTRLPSDLYWLRAAVPRDAASLCDTVAIHTQAVPATFVDRGNAPDHYEAPLPPGTITKLVGKRDGIAAVAQPYASFGATPAEPDSHFYTRVSERIRHKARALTLWDYERMVLERFPEIYKAKCLPAQAGENGAGQGQGQEPGEVTVIVIPDIRNQIPFDPFEPKAPARTIAAIADHLRGHVPAWARVEVRNAHYIAIRVRASVRFRAVHDEGFYKKTLEEDINRFLSPWAYEDGQDITIGERIYANSIIDFIERRPYVDYVLAITLFRSDDGVHFTEVAPSEHGYYVATGRPDGVLVAARRQEIHIGTGAKPIERPAVGINHMTMGLDFSVSGTGAQGSGGGIGFMALEINFMVSDDSATE